MNTYIKYVLAGIMVIVLGFAITQVGFFDTYNQTQSKNVTDERASSSEMQSSNSSTVDCSRYRPSSVFVSSSYDKDSGTLVVRVEDTGKNSVSLEISNETNSEKMQLLSASGENTVVSIQVNGNDTVVGVNETSINESAVPLVGESVVTAANNSGCTAVVSQESYSYSQSSLTAEVSFKQSVSISGETDYTVDVSVLDASTVDYLLVTTTSKNGTFRRTVETVPTTTITRVTEVNTIGNSSNGVLLYSQGDSAEISGLKANTTVQVYVGVQNGSNPVLVSSYTVSDTSY